MTPWIAWLIAAVCAAAFVALWFWEVRRMLTGRQSIVDSAASQVTAFHRRLAQTPADREAAAVLYRSESIYRQAVDNYNRAAPAVGLHPGPHHGVPQSAGGAGARPHGREIPRRVTRREQYVYNALRAQTRGER